LAYPDRLVALVLRDTWAHGLFSMLNVLKTVLTSDRITLEADRQVRLWSGNLRDDEDFKEAYLEIAPMYAPKAAQRPGRQAIKFEGTEVQETRIEHRSFHSATQNAAFSFNVPRFDVRPRLKEISVPTLVVHGRQDLVVPLEAGRKISEGIPGARLAIFEHSGHSPPSDETEAFRATVGEFPSSIGL
jgi:proline iminopeptidase